MITLQTKSTGLLHDVLTVVINSTINRHIAWCIDTVSLVVIDQLLSSMTAVAAAAAAAAGGNVVLGHTSIFHDDEDISTRLSGDVYVKVTLYSVKHDSLFFCAMSLVSTVRHYALAALHSLCDRNSVRLSVCLSVRPSVTLVNCVHMVRPTIMISSQYGSPIILVSGDITFIPKFVGGHPERGR